MSRKSKTRKLEDLSVDEFFMATDSLDEDDDEVSNDRNRKRKQTVKLKKRNLPPSEKSSVNEERKSSTSARENVVSEGTQHKQALQKLKESDPDFYKYLEENDEKLLNFDMSESDNDEAGPQKECPPAEQVTSDGNESEEDAVGNPAVVVNRENKIILTMAMINTLEELLQSEEPDVESLKDVVEMFDAAVEQAQGDNTYNNKYKVNSGTVFNGVMRMCIVHFIPTVNFILKRSKKKDNDNVNLSSFKRWHKIKHIVKKYLSCLLKVLSVMAEPAIVAVLLKHTYQMIPFITDFEKHSKDFLMALINFWSTGEETVRVLSFMIIIKISKTSLDSFHEIALKAMYVAFVKNSCFTSPSTWPLINFMKHSLVEMFALNEAQAYQYGFMYIRQLSILLRKALNPDNKDDITPVYNWQFVHCLNFWAEVLSSLYHLKILQPLIYPLVQVIIGTIRVRPTAKYYPLRFHCITALTLLTKETKTFIPVLPLITEVFEVTDFNEKFKKRSFKPLNFSCMLKLSESQLKESSFKDGLLDLVYDYMLEYLSVMANRISFPELVLPTIVKLKGFIAKCRNLKYLKKMKQLLDKIKENSQYISDQRKTATMQLDDSKAILAWETQQKLQEAPIIKFYASYKKVRERELLLLKEKLKKGNDSKDDDGDDEDYKPPANNGSSKVKVKNNRRN